MKTISVEDMSKKATTESAYLKKTLPMFSWDKFSSRLASKCSSAALTKLRNYHFDWFLIHGRPPGPAH